MEINEKEKFILQRNKKQGIHDMKRNTCAYEIYGIHVGNHQIINDPDDPKVKYMYIRIRSSHPSVIKMSLTICIAMKAVCCNLLLALQQGHFWP